MGSGDGARSWVATGVVSSVATMTTGGATVRAGLIATDALIETGTSGGVLLDRDGHAVGVLTTGADRVGVAVPIGTARDVADQLRKTGKAGHGWIGVTGRRRPRPTRRRGPRHRGRRRAARPSAAGIRADDVIVAIGRRPVTRMADLIAEVRALHPGAEVDAPDLARRHHEDRSITLGDMPADADARQHEHDAAPGRPGDDSAGRCGPAARDWRRDHRDPPRGPARRRRQGAAQRGAVGLPARSSGRTGPWRERLGITEGEVLERLGKVKELGVLRQLSAIFDTRALGYNSALVAAKVDPDHIDEAAEVISAHPGVSHNYKRNHDYNLWYTLATPPGEDFDAHLDVLHTASGRASSPASCRRSCSTRSA